MASAFSPDAASRVAVHMQDDCGHSRGRQVAKPLAAAACAHHAPALSTAAAPAGTAEPPPHLLHTVDVVGVPAAGATRAQDVLFLADNHIAAADRALVRAQGQLDRRAAALGGGRGGGSALAALGRPLVSPHACRERKLYCIGGRLTAVCMADHCQWSAQGGGLEEDLGGRQRRLRATARSWQVRLSILTPLIARISLTLSCAFERCWRWGGLDHQFVASTGSLAPWLAIVRGEAGGV